MEQFTDITYGHALDNQYRYIDFADIAYIGRYSTSDDTDMPTLLPTLFSSSLPIILNGMIIIKSSPWQ